MTCRAIRLWRFNGLVAAFLDLGIAYLLLCVSALVFFTSKFLELFGLCLPCPCDGQFRNLSSDHCFQKILVDCSSEKISSVLNSVEEKFPFDSMWEKGPKCCFNSMLVHERNVELEGEALHSSFSATRSRCIADRGFLGIKEPHAVVGLTSLKEEGKFYTRGNGVVGERWGTNLRHRHKGREGVINHGQLDMEESFQSPLSLGKFGDDDTEDSFFSVDSRDGREEASTYNKYLDKMFPDHELDNSHKEKICPEIDESSAEEAGNNCRGELSLDDNENDTIRLLEQALKEEHTARATLYLELEKERSAAGSAADEAMAMILRLQKEKASIEMDARQYQRIIEEKAAYDAEEMSILEEILMRREREMHFLEMEVEAYRKNFLDDEVDADMLDLEATPHRTSSLPYSTEDRSLMHQHINRSMSDNQDAIHAKNSSQNEIPSIESRNLIFEFGEELPIPQVYELADTVKAGGIMQEGAEICLHEFNSSKEINSDLQEKGTVYVDEKPCIPQGVVNELEAYLQTNQSNVLGMDEKSITSVGDEHEKVNNACDYQNQWIRDLNSVTDADPHPPNIHGNDIEACMHPKVSVNANNDRVVIDTSSIPVKCDSPSFNYLEHEPDITRSSSEASGRFPPMAHSRGNHLRSELRRNSMSAVDYERSKIGNEVEWLRERLKVVQEGREKLKGNMEYKEEENNQVREIQQLTDPEKAMRKAPLPPSSKVISKPRCWRSSSLSVHRSS